MTEGGRNNKNKQKNVLVPKYNHQDKIKPTTTIHTAHIFLGEFTPVIRLLKAKQSKADFLPDIHVLCFPFTLPEVPTFLSNVLNI